MKAWTSKKKASKSLKKIDKYPKAPKGNSERAVQIEAALRKYNSDILDKINSGKQIDNLFVTNKDKANLDDKLEDMEDAKLGLSSRMASLNPDQYSSKSLGKKPMFMEPNQDERWKTCIELEKKTQDPGKVITEYAKTIRKLIKRVDSERNWTEEQKIHSFIKRLRTDLFYALWPLLALKDNSIMDIAVEFAQ
ncbi:hypothetical protein G9A89_013135 [Geosiphon pyriformis]|nr:hypothetical protein G9A89_013135 [Geosiphon pyriformis]